MVGPIALARISCFTAVLALTLGGLTVAPAQAQAERVRAEGPLVRYDTALVPAGATARVQEVRTASGATVVTLQLRGLLPGRDYGAHAHVSACGSTGAAAGPHYADVVAPSGHATDPAYANPENEVWLDVTTDREGNAAAQARVRWQFREGGAGSVVLHLRHTSTGDGVAGTAGARVACLSVPFSRARPGP